MHDYERFGMWANLAARITDLQPGRAVVEATLTAEHHGFPSSKGTIVHGGAVAALADMALASAGSSLLGEGETLATVDLKVDFLRAGQPGQLVARASVRRRTRHLCFTETAVEQVDGTVVAEARAVLAFMPL